MSRTAGTLRALGLLALRGLSWLVRHMPLQVALALGRRLGDLARIVSPKRQAVALRNLKLAFGDDLTDRERRRTMRQTFRHFGMFVVESLVYPYYSHEDMFQRVTTGPGVDAAVDRCLADGHGCIAISAHLGCFELPARYAAARGIDAIVVSRPARDAGTTELMTELRERQGYRVVLARGTPKLLIQGLKSNALIGIVCDQNSDGVRLPFFGHPAGTATGPARLALRMGSPMLLVICPRTGNGRYRMELVGRVDTASTGDVEVDTVRIMSDVNALIEQAVRRYPEQWLWFHDRWRAMREAPTSQPDRLSDEGD